MLKIAPATFQRLMETVLAGLIQDICLDYLDVTGKSLTTIFRICATY